MEYWIIVDNRHAGPYTGEQLVAAGLREDTLVWYQGIPDWVPAGAVPELAEMMARRDGHPAAATEPEAADAAPQQQPYEPQEPYTHPQEAPVDVEQPYAEVRETLIMDQEPVRPAPQPRQQAPGVAPCEPCEPCPPTYVAWSIIATVLCCIPLGIPAIIFSSMVKSAYYRGDLEKARRYSNRAQWFIILAITLGVVCMPFQTFQMAFAL